MTPCSQVSRSALVGVGRSKEGSLTGVFSFDSFADKVKRGLEALGEAVWF